jgi:hypothetical protein
MRPGLLERRWQPPSLDLGLGCRPVRRLAEVVTATSNGSWAVGLGLSAFHETCLMLGMTNSAIALRLGQLNCTFCMGIPIQGGIVTGCDAASTVRGSAEAPPYDHDCGQVRLLYHGSDRPLVRSLAEIRLKSVQEAELTRSPRQSC